MMVHQLFSLLLYLDDRREYENHQTILSLLNKLRVEICYISDYRIRGSLNEKHLLCFYRRIKAYALLTIIHSEWKLCVCKTFGRTNIFVLQTLVFLVSDSSRYYSRQQKSFSPHGLLIFLLLTFGYQDRVSRSQSRT